MSSLACHRDGTRRIHYFGPDGRRHAIRLGRVSKRNAEAFRVKLDRLLECRKLGLPVDPETARWLSQLGREMYGRLVSHGLAESRPESKSVSLQAYLGCYVASRPDVRPATRAVWRHAIRNLCAFFGADRPLAEVTAADAERFKAHLLASSLGTVKK